MAFITSTLALLVASSTLLVQQVLANGDGWTRGRATAYDGPNDWWSIHEGSCGYGWLDQDKSTGWDIAALSDQFPGFDGSCGKCFEVKCDNTWVTDAYGGKFDRNVCNNQEESVIVQVTDSCPCYYPGNAYSNKRWCCGDMPHMDLSIWALQKLAPSKYGVIGIKYRQVECSRQPYKRAYAREEFAKSNNRFSRPWGWKDRRPWN